MDLLLYSNTTQEYVSITHNIVFPRIEELIVSLVEGLWLEKWNDLRAASYYGMIEMFGGRAEVVKAAQKSIPSEIKALEGKPLSVKE